MVRIVKSAIPIPAPPLCMYRTYMPIEVEQPLKNDKKSKRRQRKHRRTNRKDSNHACTEQKAR